jgi:hypothetical protein
MAQEDNARGLLEYPCAVQMCDNGILYCNGYGLFSEGSIQDLFLLHISINYSQLTSINSSVSTLERHKLHAYATL